MFRTLVRTGEIEADGRTYPASYFELRTARGSRRYSCEILLKAPDRIIIDDDSLSGLELRATRLVPATLASRQLAARRGVVAA